MCLRAYHLCTWSHIDLAHKGLAYSCKIHSHFNEQFNHMVKSVSHVHEHESCYIYVQVY